MTDPAPLLRVVSGDPSPEELAVVVAVLSAAAAGGGPAEPEAEFSRWADRAALVRAPMPTGPGAWRLSTRGR
mgnify:CR=1 FL=1